MACIESDSSTACFTEGNQIWQSCVKILIRLERISTPYFYEKWKSMLTAACQCYIFQTSDLNRGTSLRKKKIIKSQFVVWGQSYIVDEVETRSSRDLLIQTRIDILGKHTDLTRMPLPITHSSLPRACTCFCLKFGTLHFCTKEILHISEFINKHPSSDMFLVICCCTVFPWHIYKFCVKSNHSISFWGPVKYDNTPAKRDFGTDKGTLWAGISVNLELSPNQRNDFTIPASGVNQIFPTRAVVHCHC